MKMLCLFFLLHISECTFHPLNHLNIFNFNKNKKILKIDLKGISFRPKRPKFNFLSIFNGLIDDFYDEFLPGLRNLLHELVELPVTIITSIQRHLDQFPSLPYDLQLIEIVLFAVFGCWQCFPDEMKKYFASNSGNSNQGRWYTHITYVFSHQSLSHLILNLCSFITTSPTVYNVLGPELFWTLIVTSATITSLSSQFIRQIFSKMPKKYFNHIYSIGLSGVLCSFEVIYAASLSNSGAFKNAKQSQIFLRRSILREGVSWLLYSIKPEINDNNAHNMHFLGYIWGFLFLEIVRDGVM